MSFTEFYCDPSTGDNTNGGSDAGSPVFTNTNANWDGTSVFTPNNGQNPVTQGVVVGMFAAVFLDGAATATRIARVTAVTNAVNGTITLSTTAFAGAAVAVGATGRTIRVGGAWKGPNAAVGFPFTLANFGVATNAAGNVPRINMKNNASYSISTAIAFNAASAGAALIQGYSSSVGDGGRAVITTTTNAVGAISSSTLDRTFIDLEFATTATTGTSTGVILSTGFNFFYRCVFHGWRGWCITIPGGANSWLNECEFYDFNKANTSAQGAVSLSNGNAVFNCYFHDAAGSNANGISIASGNHQSTIAGNIFDGLGGAAILSNGGTAAEFISHNDFYHCGTGIKLNGASIYHLVIRNNNFIGNTTYGFDGNNASHIEAYIHNNGYGSGTEANGSGDYHNTLEAVLDDSTGNNTRIVYAANTTPYNAPSTGDFRISLAIAMNAGREYYLQTDGTNTGTVGYSDIGAANHLDTPDTPTARQTLAATFCG